MEDIVIKVEPGDYVEVEEAPTEEFVVPDTACYNESTFPFDDTEGIKKEVLESPPETNYGEIGEFGFKSDHVAFKFNSDYKNLTEAILILECQREKAIKDMDQLLELQEEALADPISFVEHLQRKDNLQIPAPQKIHQLPVIDWSKYSLSNNASVLGKRQLTRLATKVSQGFSKNFGGKGKQGHNGEQKPKLNQYWSAEEQKKLEELLVQFPPEEVESRRWEKIANCLENRTPVQVASRIQKYFIKLMKAGIPVPGRMPSSAYLKKPKRSIIRQQPSTFMVSLLPTVYMPEADDDFNYSYSQSQSTEENSLESKMDVSDDEEISLDFRNTPEYQEMKLLKKIHKVKLKSSHISHIGFKCCRCKAEPIMGIRWHCTECKAQSIDFCADCFARDYKIGEHTSDHHLETIQHASTALMDRDYMHFLGGDYNYLDPNYMPATSS